MNLTFFAQARCRQPFSVLGWQLMQPDNKNKGLVLRCYLPHASEVEAFDAKTDKSLGQLAAVIGCPGVFELAQPRKRKAVPYYFQVRQGQHQYRLVDPYQFSDQAYYAVHFVHSQPENLYRQLGAQLITLDFAGKSLPATRFAVYAPDASTVSLVGDMNHWDGRCHPMERTECGHWVLVIPEIATGTRYKFEVKNKHGDLLPHKADPLAFYAEQYPSHASLVYDHAAYQWQDQNWTTRKAGNVYQSAMSIYEVHPGSWRRDSDNAPLSYQALAAQLIPYVLEMGYTHIELMPIMEHPFDGSWGYQPLGLFAPTSRFGHPDDFKAFVDACHQAGIGVILDWVPAHFPEDGHGLARFDGSCLYEYEDPRRGWHPDWNSCIYDFGKDYVRQFLVASALYWLEHFHIDGIRVDAVASMLYWDYSRNAGEWVPNIDGGNHNYEAISLFQWLNREVYSKFPLAMTIAEESTSFPQVSRPTDSGGLGFGFKWNMGWMNDSLRYISKDPAYRQYHHGDLTFSMVYAYNENFILPLSHDEVVHGKGSLLEKMPGDEWQKAANMRAFLAFMFAHPGKKMNFMGIEFAQAREWSHSQSLDWHLLSFDKHRGMQQLFRDLNHTYRGHTPLYQLDYDTAGFGWLDHQDAAHSTVSLFRQDAAGERVYVVSNFTPIPRNDFCLGVAQAGEYEIILNTDSEHYWGSNYPVQQAPLLALEQAMHGQACSIVLNLPPLSTLYIRQKI
ncbi:1,4-alpha-glucan branching protein GlgB [Alishewanella sp. SMS8]|uniref:1,4-alpha-glucan branching protein GlgB n=1 Tax=Alishewanella sp. SMS8 TaxID=2994676 RepID=UPI002741BCCE|nr:1,4-alpha-glucan branching protein GlgB [Alishewanella sp. SMS8]MDP5035422.1 1,4-alpha-glucan branching protein GlgB [Alishewanella sp.]MDP5457937.1 1,4-alpha-glucan branching protein GlgB [Alishewanella sp. SMS8]